MAEQLALHKKRRGVARASLTKLNTKLTELEMSAGNPNTLSIARGLATRLETLDTEFSIHHLSIVDLIDDDAALDTEQGALDDYDNISQMGVRIQKLSAATTSPKTDPKKVSSKKWNSVAESIQSAINDVDSICKLQQHQE